MNTGRASDMMTRYSWWTSLLWGEIPCFAQPDQQQQNESGEAPEDSRPLSACGVDRTLVVRSR